MTLALGRCAAVALAIGWLCGCNAVLGVEDLKPALDGGISHMIMPSTAEDAGKASAAAGSSAQGTAGSSAIALQAGSNGNPSNGGTAGKGGGASQLMAAAGKSANQPAAGSGGMSQASGAGASGRASSAGNGGANTAGSDAQPGGTVSGRVIDYWRHALPDVPVRIGDAMTSTDSDGHFSLANIPSSYDVTLLLHTSINNSAATIAWQVQGLTRRDPTLQVYRALPDRDAEILLHIQNVSFPLASSQKILMGWGSSDGSWGTDLDSMDTDYLSPGWIGPATSTGTAHALLFNISSSQSIPTEYLAHDAHPVAMVANMKSDVTFDLSSGTKLGSGTLSGSVAGATSNQRINEVYLRFNDDASLQIVSDWQASDSFSYMVPALAKSALTVVAKNLINTGGEAAAYADNVGPNQSGLTLTIPSVPNLLAPGADKTGVDATTGFEWSTDAKLSLFCARAVNNYDAMYVLTAQKQTKLPAQAAGWSPAAGAAYTWTVETHGDLASADDASGADGFLSAYSSDEIRGPRRGNGSYAESAGRGFTTAQ
jgi:hypothetical protein